MHDPEHPDFAAVRRLGEIIRQRRKTRHLTLAKLGQRTGVTAAYISTIERGRNIPSARLTQRIATALDLSLEDLQMAERAAIDIDADLRALAQQFHLSPASIAELDQLSLETRQALATALHDVRALTAADRESAPPEPPSPARERRASRTRSQGGSSR